MTLRRIAASALLSLLAGQHVRADEGRIPIYQPETITQPGSYVVTRDFAAAGGAINVQASDVTLDLGSHSVSASGQPVVLVAGSATRVTVRNGTLTGGTRGISYEPDGVSGGVLVVEDVQVVSPTENGIYVAGGLSYVRISRTRVTTAGNRGIFALGYPGTPCFIELDHDVVQGAGWAGLQLGNCAAHVVGCGIGPVGTGWAAISVSGAGSVLEGNHVVGGGDFGIALQSSAADGTVRGNTVSGMASHGIWVTAAPRVIVENNDSRGNGGCGISFSGTTTSAFRDNMLRGNTAGSVCGSATDAGGNIL